ncbi:hypothetical protein PR001_g29492 [Phytophthora rubi]|uniref:SET domain-containing protein n=1 Tax=Phytophthora rubi TaxID=129364 RepID=A0A6A3H0T0_9STRA|nr:hypothetical protein PR001_g29492 [Phytophthora rubi]
MEKCEVGGETCLGLFARSPIARGEEITFNYASHNAETSSVAKYVRDVEVDVSTVMSGARVPV